MQSLILKIILWGAGIAVASGIAFTGYLAYGFLFNPNALIVPFCTTLTSGAFGKWDNPSDGYRTCTCELGIIASGAKGGKNPRSIAVDVWNMTVNMSASKTFVCDASSNELTVGAAKLLGMDKAFDLFNAPPTTLTIDQIFPNTPSLDVSGLDVWGRLSQPVANQNQPVVSKPYDPFTDISGYYDSNLRAPISFSADVNLMRSRVTNDTMLARIMDSSGNLVWGLYDKSDIFAHAEKAYANSSELKDFNTFIDSSSLFLRIEGNAMNSLTQYFDSNKMSNLIDFVQVSGQNYTSYNDISTYAQSISGGPTEGKLADIYNKVQDTIKVVDPNGNYTMDTSLADGVGVCRNISSVLATVLANNGYDASVVFAPDHAWVRVTLNGQTFDLDPTKYSYIKLPPRNVDPSQVIPVKSSVLH